MGTGGVALFGGEEVGGGLGWGGALEFPIKMHILILAG